MGKKLFIGSLSYGVDDQQLEEAFSQFGKVVSAKVIMDRETNRSKGFGFVEYETDEEAKAAIDGMNGKDLDGRSIIVNEARPQQPRSDRPRYNDGGGRQF